VKNILAADIGGTNSRFAHFTGGGGKPLTLREKTWLKTKEASSFRALMENLRQSGFPLNPEDADIAALAVAGPVERGVYSSPPLIDWDIDISSAREDFGMSRAFLINDFVAQAYACRSRAGQEAEHILTGTAEPGAAAAVLGAGTGLGKAAIVPDRRGGFVVMPSEGGHAGFPFVTEEEFEFQKFLMSELPDEYITGNVVVSGRGLSLLHRFLAGEDLGPAEVAAGFTPDSETLQWAARFYGRAARNYALETLAMGGVYIAGGVAAASPQLVAHEAFREEFRSSSTLHAVLEKIPVLLIRDPDSGLWGSGLFGMLRLENRGQK
jgi:glucokinase